MEVYVIHKINATPMIAFANLCDAEEYIFSKAQYDQWLHWLILKNHPFYKNNPMDFVNKLSDYACGTYIVKLTVL